VAFIKMSLMKMKSIW